jgi:hypothetical protein
MRDQRLVRSPQVRQATWRSVTFADGSKGLTNRTIMQLCVDPQVCIRFHPGGPES